MAGYLPLKNPIQSRGDVPEGERESASEPAAARSSGDLAPETVDAGNHQGAISHKHLDTTWTSSRFASTHAIKEPRPNSSSGSRSSRRSRSRYPGSNHPSRCEEKTKPNLWAYLSQADTYLEELFQQGICEVTFANPQHTRGVVKSRRVLPYVIQMPESN